MYGQLIPFVVALLLFTIEEPGSAELRAPVQTIGANLAVYVLFALICYLAFKSLRDHLHRPYPDGTGAIRYHQLLGRLSILALAALVVEVYVFGLKDFFRFLPGFDRFLTLSGSIGVAVYLLHLTVVWFCAHPVYRSLFGTQHSRLGFVRRNWSFHSGLLLPWLLIAIASDLLETFTLPALPRSEPAQVLALGLLLVLFLGLAPALVVRLWACDPLPSGPIRAELEAFCREHRFKIGNFLLWPLFGGESLSAAVIGIFPRLRYILVTRGLLELLSPAELKAVVAHEMGHVRRHHALFYLGLLLCYSVLSNTYLDPLLLFFLRQPTVLSWALSAQSAHHSLYALLHSAPLILAMVLYFRYLFGYFMRNSERQADLFALTLLGHPFTLISSLQKIAVHSGHIEELPSWHHFSIRQRIRCLLRGHEDPGSIRRHQLKLYGSALAFVVLFGFLTAVGWRLRASDTIRIWRAEVQLQLFANELHRRPDDPELHASYAGLLLEHRRYAEAQTILERALDAHPDHAGLLNNLAWLQATAPAPYRRPKAALDLALKAAAQLPEPHILDTLAEAYFVNGAHDQALDAIRQAIAMHPDNLPYYLKQEEKFLAARDQVETAP